MEETDRLRADVEFLRAFIVVAFAAVDREIPDFRARLEEFIANSEPGGQPAMGWDRERARGIVARISEAGAHMPRPN